MRRQQLILCFVSLYAAVALAAEDGFSLFSRFREDASLARIQFVQQNLDQKGIVGESTGVIWYRSPNFFRLEYDDKIGKPLIISDGKKMYVYEKDLQQVVVSSFDGSGEHGLLSVLTGGLEVLQRRYVFSSEEADGFVWLVGEALGADDPIPLVEIGFAAGELQQLKMRDAFGGGLWLNITSLKRGGEDKKLFSFTPPPDVVVINSVN